MVITVFRDNVNALLLVARYPYPVRYLSDYCTDEGIAQVQKGEQDLAWTEIASC